MSEDRRQALDRRDRRDHRLGGRRDTDIEPDHGTRARYRRGCPCLPCRAANAAYWLCWHHANKAGKPLLGSRVPAARTHILMRSIRDEDVSNHQLGRDLFGGYRAYKRIRRSAHVSLRTALKVQRFYRLVVADQGQLFDLPNSGGAG